jgi:hypothetical protein
VSTGSANPFAQVLVAAPRLRLVVGCPSCGEENPDRQLAQAGELYGEVAGRWERFGVVPERAHALLGAGRCLLRLERGGSEAALREARELFANLGARPLVEETDEHLRRSIELTS